MAPGGWRVGRYRQIELAGGPLFCGNRLSIGRPNVVLFGALSRTARIEPALPNFPGAGFVCTSNGESFHALRDARRSCREIPSRLEHTGAALGWERRRWRRSVPVLRCSGLPPLCREFCAGGLSVQPPVGNHNLCPQRSWPRCGRRNCRIGCAVHQL